VRGGSRPGAGGKRPGAGRKKGSPNKASAARELAAQASGMTPRDVMLAAMRHWWGLAEKHKGDRKLNEQYLRCAVSAAKDLAPYIHPKAATVPSSDEPAQKTRITVEVTGGLPQGSTPEKPEGDNYSEVPPEELTWTTQPRRPPFS
jgi:hypothetical protein